MDKQRNTKIQKTAPYYLNGRYNHISSLLLQATVIFGFAFNYNNKGK